LIRFETVEISDTSATTVFEPVSTTFTRDPLNKLAIFVNHPSGITHLSLDGWSELISGEISGDTDETGLDFRLKVLADGPSAQGKRVCSLNVKSERGTLSTSFSTSVIFANHAIGYMLLTAAPNQPFAVQMDWPKDRKPAVESKSSIEQNGHLIEAPRQGYQPPSSLFESILSSKFASSPIVQRYRKQYGENIRMSPASLDLMVKAHQTTSRDSTQLNEAVADLFMRSSKMSSELTSQLESAREIDSRVDVLQNAHDEQSANEAIESRIHQTKLRHADLSKRCQDLLHRIESRKGHKLSEKERAWSQEVEEMDSNLSGHDQESANSRYQEVRFMLITRMEC
jgi:nucleoporin NUP82